MEKQRFLLETFQSRAQIAQSKAEWIYLHFSMIEALRDHSDSEEETIRNLKLVPEGIQYRKKRHRIEVELPDPEPGKDWESVREKKKRHHHLFFKATKKSPIRFQRPSRR